MKGEVNEGEVKMKEGEHFVPAMERSQIRVLIFFLTSTLSMARPRGEKIRIKKKESVLSSSSPQPSQSARPRGQWPRPVLTKITDND